MSKITFRADDALVEQLDALDASKSEVMREALREFLDRHPDVGGGREVTTTATDDEPATPALTVNVNLDGAGGTTVDGASVDVETDDRDATAGKACKQCGSTISGDHSFCPNCGEEHRRQLRCECGEDIQSEWAFCPGCGRRSSTSDVLDHA